MEEQNNGDKQQSSTVDPSKSRTRGLRPQWQPGQSGNPAGRPKDELIITPSLRAKLDEVPGDEDGMENPKGKTWKELWIERWVKRLALEGEPRLSQQLLDRLEGPVTQQIAATVEMETTQNALRLAQELLVARGELTQKSDVAEGQGEEETG